MGAVGHTIVGSVAPFHHDHTVPCRHPDADPEDWFPDTDDKRGIARATTICRKRCHRRDECLRWALATGQVDHGILGGLTHIERRRALKRIADRSRTTDQPVRPARVDKQWGWARSDRLNTDRIRHRLAAASEYLADVAAGSGSQNLTARKWRISNPTMAEAVAVVRHAQELLDDLVDGWVPWTVAYEYAQQVRAWAARQQDAA